MANIRYIVRARGQGSALADFLGSLQGDPALELVDTIGPQGSPHTAIVAIAPALAPAFEQRLRTSPHLMIERDQPLSPLASAGAVPPRSERNTHA